MDADRCDLPGLFDLVLELPEAEWPAFLDQHCPEPQTRERLTRLLAAERSTRHWTDDAIGITGAMQRARERAPVDRIGPWQLGELLGAGGMGRVFAAQRVDGRFAQQVAIKLLHAHRLDASARRHFAQECRLLGQLNDPRIVRVLDAGALDDALPYIVMERVHGQTLDQHAATGPWALRARVQLLREVCAGVAAAHAAGIVHRDLKPANVLVNRDGGVHLLDFGIARPLAGDAGPATRTAERALSLEYAAPEQWVGGPLTCACDVYALGVMLYELICGQRPLALAGLAPEAAARTLALSLPEPPSRRMPADRRATASGAALKVLDRICLTALRKLPTQRQPDATALAADLDRWLAGQAVPVRNRPWLDPLRRTLARHVRGITGGLVLVTGVIGLSTWWSGHHAQQRAQAAIAASDLELARSGRLAALTLQLVHSADPRQAPALTARPGADWLERVGHELGQQLRADPELAAELARALGQVWLALGQPRRAADVLQAAWSAPSADALPAPLRRRLGASLLHARVQLSEPGPARALYRLLAPAADSVDPLDIEILLDGVHLDLIEGRARTVLPALPALRGRLEQVLGEAHPHSLRALQLEVDALAQQRRFDEAQPLNNTLLARQRRIYGMQHPDPARSLWRATDLAFRLRQLPEARERAAELVATYRAIYGEQGRQLFSGLLLQGNVLRASGEVHAAQARYLQAREIGSRALGPAHPHLAQLDFNRAQLLEEDLDDPIGAEPLYRQALRAHQRSLGPQHSTTGLIAWRLGALKLRQGAPATALAALDQAAIALAHDPARAAQVAVERSSALLALAQPAAAARALVPAAAFFDPALTHLRDPARRLRAARLATALAAQLPADFPPVPAAAAGDLHPPHRDRSPP